MATPIDRESVEQLTFNACADAANLNNGFPFRGEMAATVQELAHTAIALRAALDEAEARAARAAQEARAVALQEAAVYHQRHAEGYAKTGQEMDHKRHVEYARAILALLDTPAAEALAERDKRVRAEERERLCDLMDGLAAEFRMVDVPAADRANQSAGIPRVGDQFASRMRTFAAAIRAREENQ